MKTDRYHEVERRLWASIGLDPVERVVTLSRLGTKVRVLDVGEGPPVLFVHGVSASGANWAPLVAHLDGFRCLLLDRPGCGLSAPLDDDLSDLDRFGAVADELVSDVLDGLDLSKAHVVATSLGGHLALRSAAAHPDRIDRMVEFGFVPGAPLTQLPMFMRMAALPGLGRLMTSIPPTRGTIRMILRRVCSPPSDARSSSPGARPTHWAAPMSRSPWSPSCPEPSSKSGRKQDTPPGWNTPNAPPRSSPTSSQMTSPVFRKARPRPLTLLTGQHSAAQVRRERRRT